MFKLTLYYRKKNIGAHSIERIFDDIKQSLPKTIITKVAVCKYPSVGLLKRLYNTIMARYHQSDVNHVTGDIHFITIFLNPNKTILTIHDCVMMERLKGFKRLVFWFFWLWLPEKRCSLITVISEATRQQVLKFTKCDPSKIVIIFDPVSNEFQPALCPFNKSSPRILQVGTSSNKNIERVATALSGIDCKLVIIGALSKSQLNALLDNKIKFENLFNLSREDLVKEYVACDMLLFASTYEGFGLPIVEANAVGRPVVTSNVWSMPEIAGKAACLVDPFDVVSIRAGVNKVIDDADYREGLVASGFENVKRFKLKTIADQYANLYRQVYEQTK